MSAVAVPADGPAFAGRSANHALSFRAYNKSKHAQYFTPAWLAELLFECLRSFVPTDDLASVSVLDPTCGSGRLLAPWAAAGADVLGIELDTLAASHAAKALGATQVRTGDLLDYRTLLSNFSLVLTNPPYGLYWTPPDPDEAWACESSGGLLESQSATLAICTRALGYRGLLVALIPTSTFTNQKDRALRHGLFTEFEGLIHLTLPELFLDEYGIDVETDLVVARKLYDGHARAWRPVRLTADAADLPGAIRAAFQRLDPEDSSLPCYTADPVPVLSRLVTASATRTARLAPFGVTGAPDVQGLLRFLDDTVTAFDPIRGIEHGITAATLSPAALLTLGPEAAEATLTRLGFAPTLTARDRVRLQRQQAKFAFLRTPLYPPRPHQRLAYLDDRSHVAQATVTDGETLLFTAGQAYHLRPTWVRNRETAKVEWVYDEALKKNVQITTAVDRGYLAFTIPTDSGPRTFREVDVHDVELLTTAFALPEIPDLEARVPHRLAHFRRQAALRCPSLFPYQQEDVARLATKPFGYLGYEQGGGKTVTSAAWAATRGFKRVLVVCSSSLVPNWLNELAAFGFPAQRFTTHASVSALQDEKRAGRCPATTTFYVTSYEFLSLEGARRYDAWRCSTFDKDGNVRHDLADNTGAKCRECSRAFETVVTACPRCAEEATWTGGHCHACEYQAWTATADSRQWPAYKRVMKLFGAVLVDEAQLAKSKNTLRGRAVRALRPKGRLLLTGTLMKGYVTDTMWNVAWLLGFDTPLFPYPYRGGAKRFLDEFGTYQYVSRQFEETLHEGRAKLLPEVSNLNRFWRLFAPFAIRRKKEDVLALPEKRRRVYVLPLDPDHAALYRDYAEWATKEIQTALRQSADAPNMGAISNALWKLRYAATCPVAVDYLNRGHLTTRSWNKLAKILELVQAAAAKGEKTLIFSGLRTMAGAIVAALRAAGLGVLPITADVPTAKRFDLIRTFSGDPSLVALVASLNCLNRGFTITAANHVVLVDLEYSPEATDQAEDRVHRPGQSRPVDISYLLSKDTIDAVMHEILCQKAEAISHAVDGRARFTDVAELLKRVTGDIQLEVAKRVQVLPPPAIERLESVLLDAEALAPAAETLSIDLSPEVPLVLPVAAAPVEVAADLEADAHRRLLWNVLTADRQAARPKRRSIVEADPAQLSLFG